MSLSIIYYTLENKKIHGDYYKVLPYTLYNDGEYFLGCNIKKIDLKFKLIGRILRLLVLINENGKVLLNSDNAKSIKNFNTGIEMAINNLKGRIKNYDQTQLNDRIINLIEHAKMNQLPPPPPRRTSRKSPGKEIGFYKGMAFGNNFEKNLERRLLDLINDPTNHTCMYETWLNVDLSKLRDDCKNTLEGINKKINSNFFELGLIKDQNVKFKESNKFIEEAALNYAKNRQLSYKRDELYDLLNEKKQFIIDTGDRTKISTKFTNDRFNYLHPERKEEERVQGFGKKRSFKNLKLKSLKMDLKKVVNT